MLSGRRDPRDHRGRVWPAGAELPAKPRPTARRFGFADGDRRDRLHQSRHASLLLECDRIRITADGQLRTCLFSTKESDLRDAAARGRQRRRAGRAPPLRGAPQGAEAQDQRARLRARLALDVADRRLGTAGCSSDRCRAGRRSYTGSSNTPDRCAGSSAPMRTRQCPLRTCQFVLPRSRDPERPGRRSTPPLLLKTKSLYSCSASCARMSSEVARTLLPRLKREHPGVKAGERLAELIVQVDDALPLGQPLRPEVRALRDGLALLVDENGHYSTSTGSAPCARRTGATRAKLRIDVTVGEHAARCGNRRLRKSFAWTARSTFAQGISPRTLPAQGAKRGAGNGSGQPATGRQLDHLLLRFRTFAWPGRPPTCNTEQSMRAHPPRVRGANGDYARKVTISMPTTMTRRSTLCSRARSAGLHNQTPIRICAKKGEDGRQARRLEFIRS